MVSDLSHLGGLSVIRSRFGPGCRDLSLKGEIRALRLEFGSTGWDLGQQAGILIIRQGLVQQA